jgi:hypothetical protein
MITGNLLGGLADRDRCAPVSRDGGQPPIGGQHLGEQAGAIGRKTDNGASGTRGQRRPWGALSDILTLDDRAAEPQPAGNPLIMLKSRTAVGCVTARFFVGFLYISDVPVARVPEFYHKLLLFLIYGL